MDKPKGINIGEAMRWNADVERRRREHHERRCNEDPIYKRTYERQQEMMQRMQKMQSVAMAQLQNAMSEAENTKCQQATGQTNVGDVMQKAKSHVEIMQERLAIMDRMEQRRTESGIVISDDMLSKIPMAILLSDPDMERKLKDLAEESPYAEEIRKADEEFDSELIRLSGFEW